MAHFVDQGAGAKPLQPIRDLTKADVAELVKDLGNTNQTVRTLATNELVARKGEMQLLLQGLNGISNDSPFQLVHALWVLERLGIHVDRVVSRAANSDHVILRVHAMRMVGERRNTAGPRDLVLAGLKDANGMVRQAAAEALAAHPAPDNLAALLACRHEAAGKDEYLLHTVRMALRDQFYAAGIGDKLFGTVWNEKDSRALADVCVGVHNAESASFLLGHLKKFNEPPHEFVRFAQYVARFGKDDAVAGVFDLLREKFPKNIQAQGLVYKAIHQGLQEAGKSVSQAERGRIEPVASSLLATTDPDQQQIGIDLAGCAQAAGHTVGAVSSATRPGVREAQSQERGNGPVRHRTAKVHRRVFQGACRWQGSDRIS